MKRPNHRKLSQRIEQELRTHELVSMPAVLYFPPDVLDQLNELCELCQLTPVQLIALAFRSQDNRWDEFADEVLTPCKPGETVVWPEDPLYALACVAMVHFVRTFVIMVEDPVAFEELKTHAPCAGRMVFQLLRETRRRGPGRLVESGALIATANIACFTWPLRSDI